VSFGQAVMSDAEPADTPPAPEFLDPETALQRIEALTTTARNTWLLLLGFLAFIGLTLLSVRDVDFFSVSATTDLPIVNIAIPTTTFFWTAAFLAAILHTYFHVFLLKLWDALAEAPPEIGRLKLGDRVFPWLINDWALRRRADRPVTRRPMDLLGGLVTALIIWGATPLVLFGFWFRSLPAHDARLSLAIAAALWLSFFASLSGESRARARLRRPGLGDWQRRRAHFGPRPWLGSTANALAMVLSALALVAAVPVLTITTVAASGGHYLPTVFENTVVRIWPEAWGTVPIASANLVDAEIAIRPDDWREPEIAHRRFRVDWCADAGVPDHACETPTHPDQGLARQRWCDTLEIDDCEGRFREIDEAFEDEWQIERGAYLGVIRGPDLRSRDLRNAIASSAFLAGIDLRWARLEGANLGEAQLEGATLMGARLEGATLRGARLESANLAEAQLAGASLWQTRLTGANLWHAQLRRADLREAALTGVNLGHARLEGALLWEARLEGAYLGYARLDGASLGSARLEEANLYQALLKGASLVGARLDGANLRYTLLEGADLRQARLEQADLQSARMGGANLNEAWLEGADLGRAGLEAADFSDAWLARANLGGARLAKANLGRARLEHANLRAAGLEGANLAEAWLQGADLEYARLRGASLQKAQLNGSQLAQARLQGSDLSEARLRWIEWAGATFGPTLAPSADFAGGKNLTQTQLAQVIGDADTILPLDAETGEQLHVWSCWEVATAEAFVQLQTQHRIWSTADQLWENIRDNGWVCAAGEAPRPVGKPAEPAPAAE
jgi:uncharacterized protein YjbI with pentapeptide repeats